MKELANPVKCHLWKKQSISPDDLNFETLETYKDESHQIRRLLKCSECNQRYFYELNEEVDWENGNDEQFRTYIPIGEGTDLVDELNTLSPFELLNVYPRLQFDDGKLTWVRKHKLDDKFSLMFGKLVAIIPLAVCCYILSLLLQAFGVSLGSSVFVSTFVFVLTLYSTYIINEINNDEKIFKSGKNDSNIEIKIKEYLERFFRIIVYSFSLIILTSFLYFFIGYIFKF